jgi:mono/diheme cytochrome c family protein
VSTPNDPAHMNQGPDRIDYRETADITEVHASVQREKPEPSARVTPMPLWLTGICAGVMVWAGTYFGVFHGGLSATVYNEYESSPAVLFPQPKKAGAKGAVAEAPQSLAQIGKGVYGQCVACHQGSGMGVAGQFPPLAKSEYVVGGEKRLIAILLKGIQGPLTVEGKVFNGAMPPWEAGLSPKKIAAVATYIRQEWGNKAPEISEAKVLAAKKEFAAQTAPWTEAQLKEIPADANFADEGGAAAPAPGGTAPATAAPAASGADLMAEGKKNYMMICVACHQPTGMGLPAVFPPISKTPYVNGSAERFAAIILKGNGGPFTINGQAFNQIMPGQETALTDEKIAGIMTFVRASFGNTAGPVTADVVAAARKKFADRTTPWTQAELDAWKDDAPAK